MRYAKGNAAAAVGHFDSMVNALVGGLTQHEVNTNTDRNEPRRQMNGNGGENAVKGVRNRGMDVAFMSSSSRDFSWNRHVTNPKLPRQKGARAARYHRLLGEEQVIGRVAQRGLHCSCGVSAGEPLHALCTELAGVSDVMAAEAFYFYALFLWTPERHTFPTIICTLFQCHPYVSVATELRGTVRPHLNRVKLLPLKHTV